MGGRQDRWHCEHGAPLNVHCTEAPSMCTLCTAAQRPPVKVYTVHCTEAMCTLCISQRLPLNAFKGGVAAFTRGGCCHNIITSHPKFLLHWAMVNGKWVQRCFPQYFTRVHLNLTIGDVCHVNSMWLSCCNYVFRLDSSLLHLHQINFEQPTKIFLQMTDTFQRHS